MSTENIEQVTINENLEKSDCALPWAKITAGTIGEVYFENKTFSGKNAKKELHAYMSNLLIKGCFCQGFDDVDGKLKPKCKDESLDYRKNTAKWLNRHYYKLLRQARFKQDSKFPEIQFHFCPCGITHDTEEIANNHIKALAEPDVKTAKERKYKKNFDEKLKKKAVQQFIKDLFTKVSTHKASKNDVPDAFLYKSFLENALELLESSNPPPLTELVRLIPEQQPTISSIDLENMSKLLDLISKQNSDTDLFVNLEIKSCCRRHRPYIYTYIKK